MWKTVAFLLITATLTVTAGCVGGKCGSCRSLGAPHVSGHGPWECRTQARETVSVGPVDLLGFRGPSYTEASTSTDSWAYCPLEAGTCQCRAAANSLLGNLLDSQSRTLRQDQSRERRGHSSTADLEAKFLAYKAVHARNEAAAAALEMYFSLAQAEANQDFLERSLVEVAAAMKNLEDSKQAGFAVEEEQVKLLRQQSELMVQQAGLKLTIHRLNGELHCLLGADWDGSTMVWPTIDMNVDAPSEDPEAPLHTAMVTRADLAVIHVARRRVTDSNMSAVSPLMSGGIGSLSAAAERPGLLLLRKNQTSDVCGTRNRLDMLKAVKTREIHNEVHGAVMRLCAEATQLALAREILRTWNRTIEDLQDKRNAANATTFELFTARMERIAAEREVMSEIIACRIAEMKLKQAQGLLALECGYEVPRSSCVPQVVSAKQ